MYASMTYALYRAGKEQLQAHKDALFQKKQAGNEAAPREITRHGSEFQIGRWPGCIV
eukprot:COSAG01_NODE_28818_length_652_cov_0.757685_1_plen_57_part_00